MKTKQLIEELGGMFGLARDAAGSLDDADTAVEFIDTLQAETIARLSVYAKIENYARKELANVIKEG